MQFTAEIKLKALLWAAFHSTSQLLWFTLIVGISDIILFIQNMSWCPFSIAFFLFLLIIMVIFVGMCLIPIFQYRRATKEFLGSDSGSVRFWIDPNCDRAYVIRNDGQDFPQQLLIRNYWIRKKCIYLLADMCVFHVSWNQVSDKMLSNICEVTPK